MKDTGLWGRILLGTLLAAAVFFIVMLGPLEVVTLVTAAWSVLATFEFVRLLRTAGVEVDPWLLGILNLSVAVAAWLGWLPHFLLAPIAVVLITAVTLRTPRPRIPVYGVFTIVYLGFLPAHLILLRRVCPIHTEHVWLAMFPLLLTWLNDTAGWGIGKLWGRRQLSPNLSPKKTWEGFIAGLVASAVFAAIFLMRFQVFASRHWLLLALFGIGLGALAQAGDLFESIFKRAIGVKDSSAILGEHGGFLDRVDSLLFTIPAWYYLLRYYLP
ncbi:MAG: phosphatidate cytidylyltransferase [candidate division WOR-3 bacterium]